MEIVRADSTANSSTSNRKKNCSPEDGSSFNATTTTVDSGYGFSSYSAASASAANLLSDTSINVSAERLSVHSQTGSLMTIAENYEADNYRPAVNTTAGFSPASSAIKLTPVTQSIRKISDFHITTPAKPSSDEESLKRPSVIALNFNEFQTTPKKLRLDTPIDQNLKKAKKILQKTELNINNRQRKQSFRQKLKSAPDLDTFFAHSSSGINDIENLLTPKKRAYISPIRHHQNKNECRTPLSVSNSANLMHQVSTPKTIERTEGIPHGSIKSSAVKKLLLFDDMRFDAIVNCAATDKRIKLPAAAEIVAPKAYRRSSDTTVDECKNLSFHKDLKASQKRRKFHEFKKSKSSTILRKKITSFSYDFSDREIIEETPKKNEQEKKIGFIEFLNLKQPQNDMIISPLQDKVNGSKPSFRDVTGTGMSVFSRTDESCVDDGSDHENAQRNSALPTVFHKKIKSSTELEAEIVPTQIQQDDSILDERKNVAEETHEHHKADAGIVTIKNQRSLSYDVEALKILYPMLPQTPRKKIAASSSSSNRNTAQSPKRLKTKTNIDGRNFRIFYDGLSRFNMLVKLEPYPVALDKILGMCSDHDLIRMTYVSKSWRRIVRNNAKANLRTVQLLRAFESCKENNGLEKLIHVENSKDVAGNKGNEIIPSDKSGTRSVLRPNNIRKRSIFIEEKSPPVSPSKKKFHENQKVVRTIEANEKLIKCPRCERSSRIFDNIKRAEAAQRNFALSQRRPSYFSASVSTTFQSTNSSGEKIIEIGAIGDDSSSPTERSPAQFLSHTRCRLMKTMSLDHANFSPSKTFDELKNSSKISQLFGQCTGITCNFRFCVDCLCEYHPGTACKLSQQMSPTKEDIQDGAIELIGCSSMSGIRDNIRNARRKSLKRLLF